MKSLPHLNKAPRAFKIGLRTQIACALLLFAAAPAPAQSVEELAVELQAMKARMAELEKNLAAAQKSAASAEETANAAVEAATSGAGAPAPAPGGKAVVGEELPPMPDLPNLDGWWNKTSIGGYGEMHLSLGDNIEIDYHRFVLMVDHQFNDRIKLVTELELEHSIAGDGQPGEVELEQAYVDFDLGGGWSTRAGLFLLPVGILNEYHEPNTFFGTERNFVESEILPTTWWEGGIGITKKFDSGLSIDLSGHSALDVPADGANAFRIRSGRQKVGEAPADAFASTLNVEHRGLLPGLGIGASGQYQSDITQTTSGENNSAWLGEAHIDYRLGGFGLRGVYGHWDIDGATPASLGLDQQTGFYIEPSYTFSTDFGDIGIFGRWSKLEAERINSNVYDVGINFWPHENVVFKVDYTRIDDAEDQDFINLGLGFQF